MLLELDDVAKVFAQRSGKREVHAVAGVSLQVKKGETVGLVGESGCGKSTLARIALKLIDATSGRVRFDGLDITDFNGRRMLPVRRRLQAVFQDPLASLNARMTIEEILREPFDTHRVRLGPQLSPRIRELLGFVGLENIDIRKLPGQFSGGQLQRVAIARALALEPEIIVADEPTSALDPSIQAQIVNLMLEIQQRRGISYLIISHDLDVIGHIADRIAVMYLGVIIEEGARRRHHGAAAPSLHAGSSFCGANAGGAAPTRLEAHRPDRRPSQPRGRADGLSLPPTLPACRGHLPDNAAAAARRSG